MSAPLAVTMGEPAGIGPDILLALYAERVARKLPSFIVYGHLPFLRARAERLGYTFDIQSATPGEAEAMFGHALPVHDIAGAVDDLPGRPDERAAPVVVGAIAQAVEATMEGHCRAVVTGPIHKGALYHSGFQYPGHTEFLAALCARDGVAPLPVMMLAHEDLRTVPLTIHVPISAVPGLITQALIVDTLAVIAHDLRHRFHIAEPRIAVAGLNPHAGEGGAIGTEDIEIIAPAVAEAQGRGIHVVGPLPADTLFYPPHWRQYDAVLAMYHDQALVPIKTVAFDSGVNLTLGLPIVRTSPDHGTAFALAGTGKASPTSFAAAIAMADQMTIREAHPRFEEMLRP